MMKTFSLIVDQCRDHQVLIIWYKKGQVYQVEMYQPLKSSKKISKKRKAKKIEAKKVLKKKTRKLKKNLIMEKVRQCRCNIENSKVLSLDSKMKMDNNWSDDIFVDTYTN